MLQFIKLKKKEKYLTLQFSPDNNINAPADSDLTSNYFVKRESEVEVLITMFVAALTETARRTSLHSSQL